MFEVKFECLDCGCYFNSPAVEHRHSLCPKCSSTQFRPLGAEERKGVNETLNKGFIAATFAQ